MPSIRVYEPALCCNTGVCGPELDQTLVTFTADINALQERGVDIQRANLASDPQVFAQNPVVVAFLQTAGSEGLPLTLVDDVTVLTGRHPSRDELLRFAGITEGDEGSEAAAPGERTSLEVKPSSGCCSPERPGESSSPCC